MNANAPPVIEVCPVPGCRVCTEQLARLCAEVTGVSLASSRIAVELSLQARGKEWVLRELGAVSYKSFDPAALVALGVGTGPTKEIRYGE